MEQRPFAERCLLSFSSTAGPPMMPALYNNHKRIVQGEDTIVILVEMVHDARIVRMNAEHDPAEIPEVAGRFDRVVGRRHPGRRDNQFPYASGVQPGARSI